MPRGGKQRSGGTVKAATQIKYRNVDVCTRRFTRRARVLVTFPDGRGTIGCSSVGNLNRLSNWKNVWCCMMQRRIEGCHVAQLAKDYIEYCKMEISIRCKGI